MTALAFRHNAAHVAVGVRNAANRVVAHSSGMERMGNGGKLADILPPCLANVG